MYQIIAVVMSGGEGSSGRTVKRSRSLDPIAT